MMRGTIVGNTNIDDKLQASKVRLLGLCACVSDEKAKEKEMWTAFANSEDLLCDASTTGDPVLLRALLLRCSRTLCRRCVVRTTHLQCVTHSQQTREKKSS